MVLAVSAASDDDLIEDTGEIIDCVVTEGDFMGCIGCIGCAGCTGCIGSCSCG